MPSKISNSSRIAVDVTFCDLPVVRPGISRLAGVADDDAALERFDVDLERFALHAVRRRNGCTPTPPYWAE